ncbi:hypothetical protein C0J52_26005 [Blattella germanica]|nr:hypothetical protein C0J52_26005 [Blattella germanica]
MAASLLRFSKIVCDPGKTTRTIKSVFRCADLLPNVLSDSTNANILNVSGPLVISVRNTSFFNKYPADFLWKGVTSVSNAGRKRGRGKGVGKKMAKNLNKGQVIGVGKANIIWPGLTVPILRGREVVKQQQLPEDPERENKLIQLRNEMGVFRSLKLSPLERGWSGNRMPGRSIGPPDPRGEDTFEGFDTKVLELKSVFNMKGNLGRRRQMSVLAVTGNKNGSAGFALGKATDGKTAIRQAKNRSGQKLVYIEIFNNHTVYHDFFCQFGKTKIFVEKKPEGYGLVCHRAIKSACEYAMNDRLVYKRKKFPPFYMQLPSWENHLKKAQRTRNQEKVKINLIAEYGAVQSFYYDKGFPECRSEFQLPESKKKKE